MNRSQTEAECLCAIADAIALYLHQYSSFHDYEVWDELGEVESTLEYLRHLK